MSAELVLTYPSACTDCTENIHEILTCPLEGLRPAKSHENHFGGKIASSIVVVPAFGHTPGSVIIFVTLPSGTRFAFVGDIVWQLEGITCEERPWITRRRADADAEANRENLLRMIALKKPLPELIIVPAHDMRVFAGMPRLSKPGSMTASSQ